MNENKNILKIVIPIVAFIVILESLVLVNDLSKKNVISKKSVKNIETNIVSNVEKNNPINLVFSTETTNMVVGKSYPVELSMLSDDKKAMDSMSLYIKYDQSAFDVVDLSWDQRLPKPSFSKISEQKSLIVSNYLITEQNGYVLEKGNGVVLSRFVVKPKKSGNFTFEINTGNADKESATMFIETSTGKVIPFTSKNLEIITNAK